MAQLLERSRRAPAGRRNGLTEQRLRLVDPESDSAVAAEEVAGSVRMKLKDVFVSTNAALLEPPDGAERLVVFAPQRTRQLRQLLGGDIQAVVEGLQLVDWWPVADGAAEGSQSSG